MKPKIFIERIPGPFASIYEKATRMVIESYYSQIAEEVVSNLRSGTILDLGTGPGYLPIEMVKRSESLKVHGIDLCGKLINMARINASKAGLNNRLKFEKGNAAKLPFDDNSYDMVISTGMLHMLKDPIKVLKECYRVLRPGGEAWIYDPAQVGNRVDVKRWRTSFTFKERFMFFLFPYFSRINPPHHYNREEVIPLIATTDFKEYGIEQEGREIRIKLKK